ncbi:DUF4864 domain-containing protein [Rhodobacteraceae bacterium KMM 6894]|nr:DUF4864 domain-containing protein [Rhodobacteraceae bacterium KMM 6894]
MRQFILTIWTVFALTVGPIAAAQDTPIEDVISAQIEAFKLDDFERAFTYASSTIQQTFGDAERFGVMVQRGFPMVWRPADVTFLGLETRNGALRQDVLVRDGAGASHVLEYEMIEGETGWKINGVRIRQPEGFAA